MSKGKILVVEPNDDVRHMLRVYFDVHGYSISATSTFEEGSQILDTEKPQVVLIAITNDHSAPENKKAFEFATQCYHRNIKFLYLESWVKQITRGEPIPDMSQFIKKPFDIDEVRKKVDEILQETDSV